MWMSRMISVSSSANKIAVLDIFDSAVSKSDSYPNAIVLAANNDLAIELRPHSEAR